MRKLPVDPMTHAPTGRKCRPSRTDNPDEEPGVYDVRSASADVSLNGTPYNEW
jgi:hypothetical protein